MISSSWIFTSILLHVLNSFLVYLITKRLLAVLQISKESIIAFFASLIFLISPYQTEDVLWVALSIRWLFHTFLMLAGLYLFISHLSNPSVKKIISIHVLFILALFSYELTFIFPILLAVIYFLFHYARKTNCTLIVLLKQFFFPQVALIIIYFFICKFFYGYWLWHVGPVSTFTQTTSYHETLLKYFAKFFLFYRYLQVDYFDNIFRGISANSIFTICLFISLIIGSALLFLKAIKNNSVTGYFLLCMFLSFIISLIPVLPLDSSFLSYIYPDRYGYLSSVFFYIFLVSAIVFLFKKISVSVLIGYSFLCWILLMKTIPVWNETNNYCNNLIQNFKPFLKYDKIYTLNIPAYYKGVAAFRTSFDVSVYMKLEKISLEKIQMISESYIESPADTLAFVKVTNNSVEVKGRKKKTPYFSTLGGWAKSYDTDEYKVTFDPTRCSYMLQFRKDIPPNSAFVYVSNGEWKKVE